MELRAQYRRHKLYPLVTFLEIISFDTLPISMQSCEASEAFESVRQSLAACAGDAKAHLFESEKAHGPVSHPF